VTTPQARTQVRHERILVAAMDVFARRGYRDANVDDIAVAAETSKGGIYFHFPGKQAIFVALLDRAADLLFDRVIAPVDDGVDPITALDQALRTVLRLFADHRTLARLFLVEAVGAGNEFHASVLRLQDRFIASIREQLDRAVRDRLIPPQDTDLTSQIWFGALNHVVTRWALTGHPSDLNALYPILAGVLRRSVGSIDSSAERVA
jgi:AcrR family transcriptional regulator